MTQENSFLNGLAVKVKLLVDELYIILVVSLENYKTVSQKHETRCHYTLYIKI